MICKSFPSVLHGDVDAVLKIIGGGIRFSEDAVGYVLECGETVYLPYRIYSAEVEEDKIERLTENQKVILYCVFTRSNDGFVREKYVKLLLKNYFPEFVIPFIVKLCDEYVVEIIETIYDMLKDRDNCDIKRFCLNNRETVYKGYSRMTSYWDAYYRRGGEYNFNNYIGKKLFVECFGYNRGFGASSSVSQPCE